MCRKCGSSQSTAAQPATSTPPERFHLKTRIFYEGTETPVSGARYEIVDESGRRVRMGTTGEDGFVMESMPAGGQYKLRVVEFPDMPDEGESGASPETTE